MKQNPPQHTIKSVHIVPSYKCNLSCSYCYAKKYVAEYPDLTWEQFLELVDMLLTENIRDVSFIGGEPSIWPYIDKAIALLKSMGVKVGLLTNAVVHTKALPYFVTVNANNIVGDLEKKITENLQWYRKNKVSVCLRFNLSKEDTKKTTQHRLDLIQKYADTVSIAPIVPYKLTKELGAVIYNFVRQVKKTGRKINISRALPICLFTAAEYDYLKKNAGVYSICGPGRRHVVLNPDNSILPCVDINHKFHLESGLNSAQKDCKKLVSELKGVYAHVECKDCEHFKIRCQGGCFSMHIKNNKI